MSMEENAKQLSSILMPICLVLCPIGFLGGVYVFLTDPQAKAAPLLDIFFWFALTGGGFILALWYCRTHMGWFQKRK